MHETMLTPQKIVVMRYRYIGDSVLSIPFLRNLRLNYPQAQIDLITDPTGLSVFQNCPYINNTLLYGNKDSSMVNLIYQLKKQEYDTAFILKRSFSSALITFLAGIKNRIGFNTEFRKFLLTVPVAYDKNKYELECYLDVLRAIDCEIYSSHLEVFPLTDLSKGLQTIVSTIQQNNRLKILFCGTSSDMRKALSREQYKNLLRKLVFELGATIYTIGNIQDKLFYDKLVRNCPEIYDYFINLCGLTDVNESLSIIGAVDSVVGIDSGIMHLAASLKKNTVTIYGPTNPAKWQPVAPNALAVYTENLPCRPCDLKVKCHHQYQCLSGIDINTVIEKVRSLELTNTHS